MKIMPFYDVAIARHFVLLSVCIKGPMYPNQQTSTLGETTC